MDTINDEIEVALHTFHIVMMRINKEITDMIKESDIDHVVSREQIDAMRFIHIHGPLTINELADYQNIFKTAASKRIKKLEQMGYVQRVASKNKREKLVTLTVDGETFFKETTSIITKVINERLTCTFTHQEITDFVKQLSCIEKALTHGRK